MYFQKTTSSKLIFRFLIDRSFQAVNRLFALLFNNDDDVQNSHKQNHLLNVQTNDYNVKIDGTNFCDRPMNNELMIHWRLLTILKASKEMYEVMPFFDMLKYIFSESISNKIYIEVEKNVKKF